MRIKYLPEFLFQYQSANGIPLRSRLFGDNVKYNKLGSKVPWLTNTVLNMSVTKRMIGVAPERSNPKMVSKKYEPTGKELQ